MGTPGSGGTLGFQSTRPRGARLATLVEASLVNAFQSTRPRGARPAPEPLASLPRCFNPRARVGRDRGQGHGRQVQRRFNPRARVGRDGLRQPCVDRPARCFNPRARVGRDDDTIIAGGRQCVSIHAPAWGATTSRASFDVGFPALFQSTRPRGARRRAAYHRSGCKPVSIHAPAWGATQAFQLLPWSPRRFNPRARVGRDHVRASLSADADTFQSTRPRGARRPRCFRKPQRRGFNPRARVGRDVTVAIIHAPSRVSIHAPAWGATNASWSRSS